MRGAVIFSAFLIVCGLSHVHAQPAAPSKVTLTGIVGIVSPARALLEVEATGQPTRALTLRAGERDGAIELVFIDTAKNRVRIRNAGVESEIGFGPPKPGPVAAPVVTPPAPAPLAARPVVSSPAVDMPQRSDVLVVGGRERGGFARPPSPSNLRILRPAPVQPSFSGQSPRSPGNLPNSPAPPSPLFEPAPDYREIPAREIRMQSPANLPPTEPRLLVPGLPEAPEPPGLTPDYLGGGAVQAFRDPGAYDIRRSIPGVSRTLDSQLSPYNGYPEEWRRAIIESQYQRQRWPTPLRPSP